MANLATLLRAQIRDVVRATRKAFGWTQRELGRRAGVSQSMVCRIENGRIEKLSIAMASRLLDALGVKVTLELLPPIVLDTGRQRDAGHARCIGYIVSRLKRLGWQVHTEVILARPGVLGWIDIVAWRPSDRTLLIIEVKTFLADVGAVMRQHAWYEREARSVADGLGWKPRRVVGLVLVLATAANTERLRENRPVLAGKFDLPSTEVDALVHGGTAFLSSLHGLALIDPLDRHDAWILRSPLEGRSVAPRYVDYADFMAAVRRRSAKARAVRTGPAPRRERGEMHRPGAAA